MGEGGAAAVYQFAAGVGVVGAADVDSGVVFGLTVADV